MVCKTLSTVPITIVITPCVKMSFKETADEAKRKPKKANVFVYASKCFLFM